MRSRSCTLWLAAALAAISTDFALAAAGPFSTVGQAVPVLSGALQVTLGDVDLDGDLDIVVVAELPRRHRNHFAELT